MKFYTYELPNKKHFGFFCHAYDRYGGFTHESHLIDLNKNWIIESGKCHYINRTWERFSYQSTLLQTVHKAIERRKESIKINYQYENKNDNWRKKADRNALQMRIDKDETINDYRELLTLIAPEYYTLESVA